MLKELKRFWRADRKRANIEEKFLKCIDEEYMRFSESVKRYSKEQFAEEISYISVFYSMYYSLKKIKNLTAKQLKFLLSYDMPIHTLSEVYNSQDGASYSSMENFIDSFVYTRPVYKY